MNISGEDNSYQNIPGLLFSGRGKNLKLMHLEKILRTPEGHLPL